MEQFLFLYDLKNPIITLKYVAFSKGVLNLNLASLSNTF